MSEQLATCLISIVANLAGMLVIYSIMAHLLAGVVRGRGIFGIIVMIIVAQLFWIAPALLVVGARNPHRSAVCSLWLGNWLVCGFALVLLSQAIKRIPRQLEDSARLDGFGLVGTWRHVIFPFVRRDLGLIALFTVMATLLPFWALINLPDVSSLLARYHSPPTLLEYVGVLAVGSLIGTLPLIAILFLAKRSQTIR
jgi:multiple sugar transport system permease protein